jgi:hypothetical protein
MSIFKRKPRLNYVIHLNTGRDLYVNLGAEEFREEFLAGWDAPDSTQVGASPLNVWNLKLQNGKHVAVSSDAIVAMWEGR